MTAEPPPAMQVMDLARGYMVSQVVYVTAKLGLADLIASGVTEPDRLAKAAGAHPQALRRLLRAARDAGLVEQVGTGGFRLTATGETLRSDHPSSVRHMTILLGEEHYRAWSEFLHSVRTGEAAMERVLGQPIFTYLAGHPEAAASFNRGMAELVRHLLLPALSAYDFGRSSTVVDVGGGTGTVLLHLLRTHDHLHGVLVDRPDVVAEAVPELRTGDLAERCRLAGGDFFDTVPGGADTYLLARVLHDFDDQHAGRLLGNVRAAMTAGGRLVILERVLPEDGSPHPGHLHDLNMLVANGGRERSRADFDALLVAAGFQPGQVTPAPTSLDMIVAVPA